MPGRGPIRGNDLPVDALNLGARALFRSPLSSLEFTNLFSRGPLPVGQMRQQILRGPFRRHTHSAHLFLTERIKPRNQFLEDPQFLPFEHRPVHHRATQGSGDGRSSMRSAITMRLFHARTVRQRTALPVEYVPPRRVSQSVMKFPSASCALAVARKDTMEASPISSSVLMGSSTSAMRWDAAVLPIISSALSNRTKSSL